MVRTSEPKKQEFQKPEPRSKIKCSYKKIVYPVPSIMDKVKTLNDFVKALLNNNACLSWDSSLERIQQKVLHVMGPMATLWKGLEDIQKSHDEQMNVPVDNFVILVERCIPLLGQASNNLTYYTRFLSLC